METFSKIVLLLVLAIGAVITGAWAFSTLWGWFVVPLGFPALSWAHAYGIMLVVNILKIKNKDFKSAVGEKKEFSDSVGELLGFFVVYLVAVGLGWVTMLFM